MYISHSTLASGGVRIYISPLLLKYNFIELYKLALRCETQVVLHIFGEATTTFYFYVAMIILL